MKFGGCMFLSEIVSHYLSAAHDFHFKIMELPADFAKTKIKIPEVL